MPKNHFFWKTQKNIDFLKISFFVKFLTFRREFSREIVFTKNQKKVGFLKNCNSFWSKNHKFYKKKWKNPINAAVLERGVLEGNLTAVGEVILQQLIGFLGILKNSKKSLNFDRFLKFRKKKNSNFKLKKLVYSGCFAAKPMGKMGFQSPYFSKKLYTKKIIKKIQNQVPAYNSC